MWDWSKEQLRLDRAIAGSNNNRVYLRIGIGGNEEMSIKAYRRDGQLNSIMKGTCQRM
jgi:hypothetical protein